MRLNRIFDESCGNCVFYGHLKCKRHAPILVQKHNYSETSYPTTFSTDWCGDWEFQEDVNKRLENQSDISNS